MKATLGLLAVVLGAAGLVVAVVASVLAWWAAGRLSVEAHKVADQAETGLGQVEVALKQLSEASERTTQAVKKGREIAARVAAGTVDDNPELKAELSGFLAKLAPLLQQSESLGQTFKSVAALLNTASELAAYLGKKGADRAERMRVTAKSLEEAAAVLGQVKDDATAVQHGEALPKADRLVRIAERAEPALVQLTEGLERAKADAETIREALPEIRQRADFWAVMGPAIATGFLLWFALGQLALVSWGWQRLTGQPANA